MRTKSQNPNHDVPQHQTNKEKKDFFEQVVELSDPLPIKKKKRRDSEDSNVDGHSRPNLSYNDLIIAALSSTHDGRLSLQQIYDYIQSHYPYFQSSTVAWQNSIRHNLSVQKIFERVPRPANNPGKGGLWQVRPGTRVNPTEHDCTSPIEPKKKSQKTARDKKRKREAEDDFYPLDVDLSQKPLSPYETHALLETKPLCHNDSQPFAPAAEGSDSFYVYKPQGNLMDTLATLALGQPPQNSFWTPFQQPLEPRNADWLHVLHNSNFPFGYTQSYKQVPIPVLDPQVGDQTLLQATHAPMDFFSQL